MRPRSRRLARALLVALLASAVWLVAAAATPAATAAPPVVGGAAAEEVEREAREIARLLKCPVCQNVTVADSSSELAGQMREIIQRKLEAGESRDEIVAYFVASYGEDVLLEPPKSGFGGLAWLVGAAIPLIGLVLVWSFWRGTRARVTDERSETESTASPAELAEAEARLEREVGRARSRGVSSG